MTMQNNRIYVGKTIGSFLIVLLLMPLGHALMILMEHLLAPTALHPTAFAMGFVGLVITIAGVLVKGNTKQTCFGITGAMLYWTGWVEFLFAYYAQRYGAHTDGLDLQSRPEYLIMPATFGMWMMFMVMYVFCTRTGCDFIRWIQKHSGVQHRVELRPMAYHPSIVVFMEWNVMMWGLYLLLMFCYDPVFLGQDHPVTWAVAIGCLAGSALMLKKQLRIGHLGRNIRMSLATVMVFWTFVEIVARNGFFKEIWVDPMHHIAEMSITLGVFLLLVVGYWMYEVKNEDN